MSWVAHLLAPVLVAVVVLIAQSAPDSACRGITQALSQLGDSYLMFSAPLWLWAAIAAYFTASRRVTFGGFSGAHLLLVAVAAIVLRSAAPEAANGWLLYFVGSPVAITLGAIAGGLLEKRASKRAA